MATTCGPLLGFSLLHIQLALGDGATSSTRAAVGTTAESVPSTSTTASSATPRASEVSGITDVTGPTMSTEHSTPRPSIVETLVEGGGMDKHNNTVSIQNRTSNEQSMVTPELTVAASVRRTLAAASIGQALGAAVASPFAANKGTAVSRNVGLAVYCAAFQTSPTQQLDLPIEQFVFRGPDGPEGPAWVALATTIAPQLLCLAACIGMSWIPRRGKGDTTNTVAHLAEPMISASTTVASTNERRNSNRSRSTLQHRLCRVLFTTSVIYFSPNVAALSVRVLGGRGAWGFWLVGATALATELAAIALVGTLVVMHYSAAAINDPHNIVFLGGLFVDGCREPSQATLAARLRRLYGVLDIVFALAAAVIASLPFDGASQQRVGCSLAAWSLVALAGLQLLLLITLRPLESHFEFGSAVLVLAANTMASVICALAGNASSSQLSEWQQRVEAASYATSAVYFINLAGGAAFALVVYCRGAQRDHGGKDLSIAGYQEAVRADGGSGQQVDGGGVLQTVPMLDGGANNDDDRSSSGRRLVAPLTQQQQQALSPAFVVASERVRTSMAMSAQQGGAALQPANSLDNSLRNRV